MAEPVGNRNLFDEDDDSDSDDVDYVPSDHDSLVSDVEVSGDESEGDESEGDEKPSRKRKGSPTLDQESKKKAIDEKERSNLLWQQFKFAVKKQQSDKSDAPVSPEKTPGSTEPVKQRSPSENIPVKHSSPSSALPEAKTDTPAISGTKATINVLSSISSTGAQIKAMPNFPGQSPKPSQAANKFGAGISPSSSSSSNRLNSILANIGQPKKSKNMLEQSRKHWEDFKQKEGISDELALHNRGAKGYLDRQDFLARVDTRQGDQLREMRLQLMNKRRTK